MKRIPSILGATNPSTQLRGDDNYLFPRCQHPDTRTDKEFLRVLENRLFIKHVEDKAKRSYRVGQIMCLQTGEVYNSASDAEQKLGLNRGIVSKNLRGEVKMCDKKSYSFIFL